MAPASAATRPLSFQGLILKLQNFWAEQGCVILQPYDMEVGAGTFHPATFLRSLGPEPWNAAYVQPCRRPTDGRYGENPNRLQRYYQYQVAMKPSPDNIVELYFDSLKALGVDPQALLDEMLGRATGVCGGRAPRTDALRPVSAKAAHARVAATYAAFFSALVMKRMSSARCMITRRSACSCGAP